MLGGPEFLYANITMRAPRRFSAWKTMLAKVFFTILREHHRWFTFSPTLFHLRGSSSGAEPI
jgi:hypothetical protein